MNLIELAKGAGVTSKRTLTRLIDDLERKIGDGEVTAVASGFVNKNEILAALKIPKSGQYANDVRVTNWIVEKPEEYLESYKATYTTVSKSAQGVYKPKATTEPFYDALNALRDASLTGKGLDKAAEDFLIIYNLSQPVMKIPPMKNPPQSDKLPKGYSLDTNKVKIEDGVIRPVDK